eukprot:gnl/MRDRNA2_/MRDRNA2_95724_c0_seq1.p1 gnl/MRDRNA2_/MRDRNA2_95724_c0~~gnl/MRDRNA2_/MRDRNA2_95724_c0_seq1.p1  ORF type:complete len:508 (-),score=99.33 gnl/MRDRNA2_/MRDRNA2_95724_c0_seq1:89-1612(-)
MSRMNYFTVFLLFSKLASVCLASPAAGGVKTSAGAGSSSAETQAQVTKPSRHKGRSVKCRHKPEESASSSSSARSSPATFTQQPTSTYPPDLVQVEEGDDLGSTTLAPSSILEGDNLMQSSDANKENTKEQLEEAMPGNLKKTNLAILFGALDTDADGKLSADEIQIYMEKCATCWVSLGALVDAIQAHVFKEQASLSTPKSDAVNNASVPQQPADDAHAVAERIAVSVTQNTSVDASLPVAEQRSISLETGTSPASSVAEQRSINAENDTSPALSAAEERSMSVQIGTSPASSVAEQSSSAEYGTSPASSSPSDGSKSTPVPLQYRQIHLDNFNARVRDSNFVWMLEFYSAMCGACQQFSPTFDELSKKLNDKVLIGKVNIDEHVGLKLAQNLGVLQHGVPSIRLYTAPGSEGQTVLNGISLLEGVDPTAESLAKVAFEHLEGLTTHGGKMLKLGASSSVPLPSDTSSAPLKASMQRKSSSSSLSGAAPEYGVSPASAGFSEALPK